MYQNRLLEILIYLVLSLIFLVLGILSMLGLLLANVNYQVLFFILTAVFFFAMFRPTRLL